MGRSSRIINTFHETEPIQSGEFGALKRYDLTGENWDRRIAFTMVVFARSAGSAVSAADKWRRENNRVHANKWTTRPGL